MTSPVRLFLTVPATAGMLALAGCSLGDDGPSVTQTRDVGHFTRIDNRGSVDVRLHVGEPQRVEVRAGDKVVDDVHMSVHDGTLRLTFDHDYVFGDVVVVEASVPQLTGIQTSGSGDIDVDGVDAGTFEVRSDGSADVAAEGTVGRLAVDLDGSGDADLADLTAGEARVFTGGSGDVDVRAHDRLEVHVSGSGDVSYFGDPALTRQVDGSGDLSQG